MKINQSYLEYIKNKSRTCVLVGGAGSGKSVAMAQKAVVRMISERGHTMLVVRKYFNTLRNSIYTEIKNCIEREGLAAKFAFTTSPLEIVCKDTNGRFVFHGLDDPEKIKSIANITAVLIEEASELNAQDYQQINLRLRPSNDLYPQITMCMNPVSNEHFVKRMFFDTNLSDAYTLRTTYKNNAFLSDDYRRALEHLKFEDTNYYNIYARGEWGVRTEAQIFTNYEMCEVSQDIYSYEKVSLACDFGFNHASAVLMVGIKDKTINILHELYGKGMTNTDLIALIKDTPWITGDIEIVCDSAEPDRIVEMRRAGLNVSSAKKGPGSIKLGIDFLRRYKINIHPSCIKTYEEIKSYSYKKDKSGLISEEPVDVFDDCISALRYSVEKYCISQPAVMSVLSGLSYSQ